jgi:hypothetical protein
MEKAADAGDLAVVQSLQAEIETQFQLLREMMNEEWFAAEGRAAELTDPLGG